MLSDIHVLLYQHTVHNEKLISTLLSQEKGIILYTISTLASIKRYQALYGNLCVIYDCDVPSTHDLEELAQVQSDGSAVLILAHQGQKVVYHHRLENIQWIYKPQHITTSFVHALIVKIKCLNMPVKSYEQPALYSTHIVVIGASTGGPRAIETILKDLCTDTCGIIIVQHMKDTHLPGFVNYLKSHSTSHVKGAQENELVRNGNIYIAKENRHLIVERQKDGFHLHYTNSEKVNCVCPSIDVLFHSVAKQAGCLACGILLTGMGEDGAAGLKAMKDQGAFTIIQDEASSDVYGMPKVAKVKHAQCVELPLQQIAPYVNRLEKSYERKSEERENERENKRKNNDCR